MTYFQEPADQVATTSTKERIIYQLSFFMKFISNFCFFCLFFSVGMRSCLGEQLAWRELFLITCRVLQKFTLKSPAGHEAPSVTTGTTGVARSPLPFTVQVTER